MLRDVRIKRSFFVTWIEVAEEVPRRIDKRVHRVSITTRWTMTLRTFRVDKLRHTSERRLTSARERCRLRQHDRQPIVWDWHHDVFGAIDHGHRRAPETLPGNAPVTYATRHRSFAEAVLLRN